MRDAFRRWGARQDFDAIRQSAAPIVWLPFELAGTVFLAAICFVPTSQRFFGLDFVTAWLTFQVPIVVWALALRPAVGNPERTDRTWLALLVLISAVKWVAVSLLLQASQEAAVLFAALFVNLAAFYGFVHRARVNEPFVTVGTVLAALAACAAFPPSVTHLPPLLFALGAGLISELTFGVVAQRHDEAAESARGLREAVEAQMLAERQVEVIELRERLTTLLGLLHDIANAVAAMTVDSAMLREATQGQGGMAEEIATDMVSNVTRVRALIDQMRVGGQHTRVVDDPVRVSVEELLNEVVASARRRYPSCDIAIVSTSPPDLFVRLPGGPTTLRRVLDNLVLNALQGDGSRGADHVVLVVHRDATGSQARIEVKDDGPGFAPSQLATAITGFVTTKRDGTGLGLYTSEKLVRSSGGTIERGNQTTGGGIVTVKLPLG